MSSSQPVGKKAAISSFFSKNKQKKGGAAGGAGAYGAGDGSENSIIKSSDLGVPGVSDGAGAWDDTNNDADAQNTPDTALGGTAIASKLHMGVGDLEAEDEDLDDDEKIRRSIEAQDARQKLIQARQHAKQAASHAAASASSSSAPAPAPAEAGPAKWRPKFSSPSGETQTSSRDSKEPNIKDEKAFPTLGHSMAGFAPGAKFVKQEKGLASLAGRNQWADLVDDEEEEEEEEAGAGASAAPTSVAAKPSAPAPAPPAVAAPDLEGPAAEGLIRPLPGAKVLETDAAVRAAVERICAELKESKDYPEALRRMREELAFPVGKLVHMRVIAAESIALYALECISIPERMTLGKLLPCLVPTKIISRPMMNMAVGRVNARLDVSAWASDYPKAKEWMGDILSSGAVAGTKLWHPSDASAAGAAGVTAAMKAAAAAIPAHDAQAVRDGGYVPLTLVHPKVGSSIRFSDKVSASQLKDMGKDLTQYAATLRKEIEPEDEEEDAETPARDDTPAYADRAAADLRRQGIDADGPTLNGRK